MLADVSVGGTSAYYDYLPAGRAGTPVEIAELAVFLASEESAYITGTDLVIDGGMTGGAGPRVNFPGL